MGVNLPAHLVIIKSTQHYTRNGFEEYSETEVLQMIGRAGRPQFDTTATAVIMTKRHHEQKYERLAAGKQIIESRLAVLCSVLKVIVSMYVIRNWHARLEFVVLCLLLFSQGGFHIDIPSLLF